MSTVALHPVVRRPPPRLLLPSVVIAAAMLVPLVYLMVRAGQADGAMIHSVLWRSKTAWQLVNTVGLALSVLGTTVLLGVPLAWLTTSANLSGRRWWTLLAVLPLAIPGYLLAYALLAVGGSYGTGARLWGVQVPRLYGFWGAWVALSLYNLPYMFLNLRVAMRTMDPALQEAARSLGLNAWQTFFRVTVPQMRPAMLAGGLLVVLHVIGDFGVVSLMRFETFSYALYSQYTNQQREVAAWLGLLLVAMTAVVLFFEWRFLRGLRLDPAGIITSRSPRPVSMGVWSLPAYAFLTLLVVVSLVIPLSTVVFWVVQGALEHGFWGMWARSLADSVRAALPAAVLTTGMAIPVAYMARRYPSFVSHVIERSVYIGYATPALAFGLGWVVFALWLDQRFSVPVAADGASAWAPRLYQTMGLLVVAYSLHFLAEAIGPVRSSLFVATPRLEEASRGLGHGRVWTFMRVTLPLLRPGIVASMALVFLSVMKELPLTFILAPLNFQPLSLKVWDYTNEAMYAEAAPYALTIVLCAGAFVGLLLTKGEESGA